MLKVMSTTFRLTAALRNNKNFGFKNLPVGSFSKLLDAKKVTNCQFNRLATKALDISNHQPTLPTTSTKQIDNVIVSKEGSEFDKFIEKLENLNGNKPINEFVKYILDENEIHDVSSFAKLDLDELIKLVVNDMIMKPGDYKALCPKLKFSLGNKMLLKDLIQKAKNKINEPLPRKPFDKNRKPQMVCPGASIETLIENKCYVDKTEYVMKLLKSPGNYVFTRPRRFGKSSFLEVVKYVCNNDKELFNEYYIGKSENKYQWKKYPVIELNFSVIFMPINYEPCKETFIDCLKKIANENNILLEVNEDVLKIFENLVIALKSKYDSKVVILIDEYDYLITHSNYNDIKTMKNDINHENSKSFKLLKSFFNLIKYIQRDHLQLVLSTGIVKTSYNDIFSGGNNHNCLDYHDEYSKMIGFTSNEIMNTFNFAMNEWIKLKPRLTIEHIMKQFKKNYNGYSFNRIADQNIYNSWSIMKSLFFKEFDAYWMDSGSPSVLINTISANPQTFLQSIDFKKKYSLDKLLSYYYETDDIHVLMFQLGYLTLTKRIEIESDDKEPKYVYHIDYPNNEVKTAYINHLLRKMFDENVLNELEKKRAQVIRELKKKNIIELINFINKPLREALKTSGFQKRKDGEPMEIVYNAYIFCLLCGLTIHSELQVSTGKGIADLVIHADEDTTYVFEIKVLEKIIEPESRDQRKERSLKKAKDAIYQITEKKYDANFLEKKNLQIVGMVVSEKEIIALLMQNLISYNVKDTHQKKIYGNDFEHYFDPELKM